MSSISQQEVVEHFEYLERVWPSTKDALLFIFSEVAEATELDLIRASYKRNNPGNKKPFTPERYAEELGDVIYMCLIAGEVEGVDPIQAMRKKMGLA